MTDSAKSITAPRPRTAIVAHDGTKVTVSAAYAARNFHDTPLLAELEWSGRHAPTQFGPALLQCLDKPRQLQRYACASAEQAQEVLALGDYYLLPQAQAAGARGLLAQATAPDQLPQVWLQARGMEGPAAELLRARVAKRLLEHFYVFGLFPTWKEVMPDASAHRDWCADTLSALGRMAREDKGASIHRYGGAMAHLVKHMLAEPELWELPWPTLPEVRALYWTDVGDALYKVMPADAAAHDFLVPSERRKNTAKPAEVKEKPYVCGYNDMMLGFIRLAMRQAEDGGVLAWPKSQYVLEGSAGIGSWFFEPLLDNIAKHVGTDFDTFASTQLKALELSSKKYGLKVLQIVASRFKDPTKQYQWLTSDDCKPLIACISRDKGKPFIAVVETMMPEARQQLFQNHLDALFGVALGRSAATVTEYLWQQAAEDPKRQQRLLLGEQGDGKDFSSLVICDHSFWGSDTGATMALALRVLELASPALRTRLLFSPELQPDAGDTHAALILRRSARSDDAGAVRKLCRLQPNQAFHATPLKYERRLSPYGNWLQHALKDTHPGTNLHTAIVQAAGANAVRGLRAVCALLPAGQLPQDVMQPALTAALQAKARGTAAYLWSIATPQARRAMIDGCKTLSQQFAADGDVGMAMWCATHLSL